MMERFKNKKLLQVAVICLIWGIFAHGMIIFNKYSAHDDLMMSAYGGVGCTITSGRWMLCVFEKIFLFLFGCNPISTPLTSGLLSIVYIALICYLVLDMLEIESLILKICYCGIAVVFPSVTATFGYIFTAHYYFFGLLIGVFGIWLVSRKTNWYRLIICACFIAIAIGTYQANLPVCISLLLMLMMEDIRTVNKLSLKQLGKFALKYIGICIVSVGLYAVINSIALKIDGSNLTDYGNINTYGLTDVKGYFWRVYVAYMEFIHPTVNSVAYMFPIATRQYYKISIIIVALLSAVLLVRIFKEDKLKALAELVLFALVPLATNFIYFMCEKISIHSLTVYGITIYFVFYIWVIKNTCEVINNKENHFEKISRYTRIIASAVIIMMCAVYCKFDNICYSKAYYNIEQTKNYFNTLITRIKSTEGYKDEYPVVYINENEKYDLSYGYDSNLDIVNIYPYCMILPTLNGYTWQKSMEMWSGFNPIKGNESTFEDMPEVIHMPHYPDDGSIKVIEETIVVKF